MRRAAVRLLLIATASAAVVGGAPAVAGAQDGPQRFTGTTSQGAAITLTVSGSQVRYAFAFSAECSGERRRIPISGSVKLTPTGAFLDDGTFASGTATFTIEGNAPAAGERTGSIELTSPDCEKLQATWRARPVKPAAGPTAARSCPDPAPTARLALSKLRAAGLACTPARTAATRWARDCYQRQWLGGAATCRVTVGGRAWSARTRTTGPSGSGGLSRVTLTAGSTRLAFDAQARPTS